MIGANGTYFVAVTNGGKLAWLSYDGRRWTPIAWTGGDPTGTWYGGDGFLVMPRGVLLANSYGAASRSTSRYSSTSISPLACDRIATLGPITSLSAVDAVALGRRPTRDDLVANGAFQERVCQPFA